jgi:hemoglobin-like flavoprotein
MTPEQIDLVEATFAVFYPERYDAFASDFYERLFALNPALRPLFPADMSKQRSKLMTTFNIIINGLRHPDSLRPVLSKLGGLHVNEGVRPADYQTLGVALNGTLESYLGAQWSPGVAEAWSAAYSTMTSLMQPGS